ncbi:MAG: BTAD domain-containing putative transcriptional regulator [Actinomycetota bacterium]
MSLEIRLLGSPAVLRDGVPVPPPRGNKSWAVLAYLLLNPTPVSRVRVASLLFSEADDPLATLRWNLNALRKLIGDPGALRGDPLDVALPPDVSVDVLVLRAGSWQQALTVAALGNELLEGISVGAGAGFEAWLAAERQRTAKDAHWAIREAVLARLGRGEADEAARLASKLVAMDPLDEGAHELLVRCLAAAGEGSAARKQLQRAVDLIRGELGVEPGQDLMSACDSLPPLGRKAPEPIRVQATLETGLAAVFAAQGAGLDAVRQALLDARELGHPELLLRSLHGFAMAWITLNHGGGEEAAAALQEAIALADRLGAPRLSARGHRWFAFTEFWRGHYDRAHAWLRTARELVGDDRAELARIEFVRGGALFEVGTYGPGIAALEESVSLNDPDRDPHGAAFALLLLGRAHLLREELDPAEVVLRRSASLARSHWIGLLPHSESLLADVFFRRGELADAADGFEHAYALASQHYGSECWESIAGRGLGLVADAKGDVETAVRWLEFAITRRTRWPGAYPWIRAWALDALCEIAVKRRLPDASAWIADLEERAARLGMRELLARAHLHRSRLGEEGSLEVARALAAEIDNPALQRELGR